MILYDINTLKYNVYLFVFNDYCRSITSVRFLIKCSRNCQNNRKLFYENRKIELNMNKKNLCIYNFCH